MSENENINKPVLLVDSECALCNKTVNFIVKHDGEENFRFVSLYSDEGKTLLKKHGFPEHYKESVVLVDNGSAHTKSDAALLTAKKLPGLFPVLYGFRFIPKKLRDKVYDFIARHRHKIFT